MSWNRLLALCAFVLLAASRWLLEAALPSGESAFEGQAFPLILPLLAAAWPGPPRQIHRSKDLWLTAGAGLLLFSVPVFLLQVGRVPEMTRASVMALVPTVLVLLTSAAGEGDFLGLLTSSLAGLGGCLLVLPVDLDTLRRPVETTALLATAVSIAVGGVLIFQARRTSYRGVLFPLVGPSFLLCVVTALVTKGVASRVGWVDLVYALWDGAELLLLVYLLRTMAVVAIGSRFFLIPLATISEGLILVRPAVSWRSVVGLTLLGYASWQLLRRAHAQDSSLSLL